MEPAIYRGDDPAFITSPSRMEPMLPPDGERAIEDAAFDLIAQASALAGQIHPSASDSVGALVRSMNCYYSNLIEDWPATRAATSLC